MKLVGQSSGIAYGKLGPTHQSIEDFAWLRPLTGLTVICPADPWQVEQAVIWAAAHDGPVYIRLSRMAVPRLEVPRLEVADRQFRPGVAERVRAAGDVALIACGTTVHLAVGAADLLATEGVAAMVLNHATLNPLDQAALAAAAETGVIATVEEASVRGGLGGAVAGWV